MGVCNDRAKKMLFTFWTTLIIALSKRELNYFLISTKMWR